MFDEAGGPEVRRRFVATRLGATALPWQGGRNRTEDGEGFDGELPALFYGHVHRAFGSREFVDRAAKFAVGGLTATALVESLLPRYAWAILVREDDARITTKQVTYESPEGHGAIRAHIASPAGSDGPFPAVVVVHENRGLNRCIEEVAWRLGIAGYLAVARDGLSPLGGYPGNGDEGRAMQRQLDRAKQTEGSSYRLCEEAHLVLDRLQAIAPPPKRNRRRAPPRKLETPIPVNGWPPNSPYPGGWRFLLRHLWVTLLWH